MNVSRARRIRLRLAALMVPLMALALLGSSSARPAAAGGLRDFVKKTEEKKTEKKTEESGKSSGSSGSSERKSTPSVDRSGGSLVDIFKKSERRDSTPAPTTTPAPSTTPAPRTTPSTGQPQSGRRGGLFDIFTKRSRREAGTSRPSTPSTGESPRNPPSAGGGLVDIFSKPGRPQAKRPAPTRPVSRPPAVVTYHYYDPWYYPYDRVFYDNYGPWVVYRRDLDPEPYGYDRNDLYERRADEALRDIERGWEERKFRLIALHLDADGRIAVYHDGEYSHAMAAREFRALTLQSFDDVRTVRFRFYDTQMRGDYEVRGEGEHVFVGPDGEERRVRLLYVLRRTGRHWLIQSIDLRQQRRYSSLTPVEPEALEPVLTLSSIDAGVAVEDTSVALAALPLEVLSLAGTEPAVPAREGPRLILEEPDLDVAIEEPDRVLVAAIESPTARPVATGREASLRVVCTGKPVAMAALRAAKAPVNAATVICLVLKAAPGMPLVPGSRLTCNVHLRPAKDGIAWTVLHKGEARGLESGVIPLQKLGGAGYVRVVVDRVSTPVATGKEQRVPLFARTQWDYQVALVASPKAPSPTVSRTELLISSGAS